jgi:hypothetical protein
LPIATVADPLTVEVAPTKVTTVFERSPVSVMVTFVFCLKVVASVTQFALVSAATEAAAATTSWWVTVALPADDVPETVNVTLPAAAPIVTLQIVITPGAGAIVTALGLTAAFAEVPVLALPFLTVFLALCFCDFPCDVTFDELAWVCPMAAANIPPSNRIITASLFTVPPFGVRCRIGSLVVSPP